MVGPLHSPSPDRGSHGDVEPIQKSGVTTEAVERIKQMILTGRYTPGSKLPPERELSEMLGISRSSIREAIRALTHMNILEARHGQGTYVTSLSPRILVEPLRFVMAVDGELIYQLFELRKIMETGAAALAATRITLEQLVELRHHYESLVQLIDVPHLFLEHDVAMHELIFRAADNVLLLNLHESIFELLLESRNRTGAVAAIRARTVVDHGEILKALEARDPDRSSAAMMEHLDHVESKLRELGGPRATPSVQRADTDHDEK
jgi:GntR family transcriptional regulator, transcriptional repressor for pyruvate dehydrogenase complex